MISRREILETIHMISDENLDIRTVTMGISLRDCAGEDINRVCDKIYDKITKNAKNLVYESEWTSYGNPREYTLYNSLQEFLFSETFPYFSELQELKTISAIPF